MRSRKAAKLRLSRKGVLLSLSAPANLQTKVQELQLAIARRAHELFDVRGQEHGHDLSDWFQAESELVCPVSVAMSQSSDCVKLRANVAGFDEREIEVSVEPGRIVILGKKAQRTKGTVSGTTEQTGSRPDQFLQVIDLATEVVPEGAIVELKAGELICELPVASKNKTGTAA
jgi:HSP20 family molecular chaperone IbpA